MKKIISALSILVAICGYANLATEEYAHYEATNETTRAKALLRDEITIQTNRVLRQAIDYTQAATNMTLQAAMAYTDAKDSGIHTNDVVSIVHAEVDADIAGKANVIHAHAIADINDLQTTLNAKANSSHTHSQGDVTGLATALANKANLMGGNIYSNDQWIANGDLNLVAAGFYVDRSGTGQEYIDGRWNGDYWAFMGTKRFLILNGLDFSSATGASAPTIDGNAIATTANLASKVSTNSTITIKREDTPYGATQSLLDYYGLEVTKSGTGGGTILLGMNNNTSQYPQLSLYRNAGMYVSETAELIYQGDRSWQDFGLTNAAAAKQDVLTAGENITISNNVISATGGSVEPTPGWYRDGDWRPIADVNTTRLATTFTHSTTNDIGSVYSNVTITVGYDLSARLRTEMLDEYSINPPPQVTWSVVSSSASITTNTIVATSSGVYHILATATNGVQKSVNVPLSARPTSESTTTYYAADISTNRWIKATNDEFLQLLSTITTDGVVHPYQYGEYLNWNFPTNRVLFRHGNTSYGSYLISPHVVASADHYWNAYSKTFTATFYAANGTAHNLSFTSTGKNVAKRWNLADWARAQHKWTDEEINAMRISDITVYIADSGSAAAESCPYFISEENWNKFFGVDRRSILGWGMTQLNSDKRKCAYPMAIDCNINGTINFASPAIMDSSTYWQDYGSGQPMMRADIREYFRNLGSNANYWKFPAIYSGDSGSPVFIFHDQRPILLSHFWTTSGGPNYIKGLPVLREFCDKQVKAALGISQGDILKEVE